MIYRIIFFILISTIILFAGDPELSLNLYKHQLIEESFEHTDSLQGIEVQKKSVGRAALYSAVLPGAGQYYNGSIWKTILFAGIEVAAWTAYFVYDSKGDQSDTDMRSFADMNWSEHKYWSWLYDKAQQQNVDKLPTYTLTDRNLETGIVYLVDYDQEMANSLRFLEEELNHTHKLPETKTQQYYEMIYKYPVQFANGWSDAILNYKYAPNASDLPSTAINYRYLRNLSEEYYDVATAASMTALINHVISALDAALAAKSYNRSLDMKFTVKDKYLPFEKVRMYGLQLTW
ncbi:MAG: hypothetical protein KAS18_07160 [Calditrichia bacterium]|nr:hypothetical protein [Calditrichia bacterium]